jgi:hypothetical protein
MENEPTSVSVSVSGTSLQIQGMTGVGRIVDYLADVVGLIGEPIGYVTDSIRAFRIHRAQSVAAAMLRAKQICDEENRPFPKVPPKLLAPWIEGVSQEDMSSENIGELWAQLLSRSPDKFDSMFAASVDVLSRLGPGEARELQNIYQESFCEHKSLHHAELEMSLDRLVDKVFRKFASPYAPKVTNKERVREEFEELLRNVKKETNTFDIYISDDEFSFKEQHIAGDVNDNYRYILLREGLIWELSKESKSVNFKIKVRYIVPSPLGSYIVGAISDKVPTAEL